MYSRYSTNNHRKTAHGIVWVAIFSGWGTPANEKCVATSSAVTPTVARIKEGQDLYDLDRDLSDV